LKSFYQLAAIAVLALHLLWILWVIFGFLLVRPRPAWAGWLHIGSLLYGVVIELGPWDCPLTAAEQWLQFRAGTTPYRGGFLLHYLDAIVYPDLPLGLLTALGVAVCLVNLGLYAWQFATGWWSSSGS